MRAAEFIRENVEHFNGLDFSIEIEKDDEYVDDDDTDNQTIYVRAFANGRELGHVLFSIDYDGQGMILKPQDLEVDERFQGQGIAATMYDYVKSKGYRIRRSGQQTDAGAGFWNKHRPEQNVWEGVNRSGVDLEVTELPDEDQILITATSHGKTLGRVYFDIFDSQLVAADAEVASEYRGQGIAAIIYDYAKELGWEVVRSGRQTDAGAGFWDKHRPKQDVWEDAKSSDRIIFIGNDTAIVGQEHGKRLQLSDSDAERVQAIAQRHGAWYEGNGMDRELTAGIINDYRGSWDDDLLSPAIKGYPAPFLYVLFSNIKENDTVEGKIGFDPDSTIFDRILDTQPSTNYFP
jgi:predicted GNAT family acetyltransferase